MDAHQTSVDHPRNEVDTWLHTCNICVHQATNPVAATCGHLFCLSCLNDAFPDGLVRQNACPICDAELPEETADNFSIVESVASAGPTSDRSTIVSEAAASAGNNITMTGPVAAAGMRSDSLISRARMEVVQDMLDEEREQVDLIRISSNWMAQRIRDLEQAFERMSVDLRREMEDRDEHNGRLRRRIVELENPTTRARNNISLGMNSVRHRRFGRRSNHSHPTCNSCLRHRH